MRLKVDDGVIVFPVTAKGRKVSAEGVFEIVGNAGDAKDASEEHAKHDARRVAPVSAQSNRGNHLLTGIDQFRPLPRASATRLARLGTFTLW